MKKISGYFNLVWGGNKMGFVPYHGPSGWLYATEEEADKEAPSDRLGKAIPLNHTYEGKEKVFHFLYKSDLSFAPTCNGGEVEEAGC